MRGTSTKSRTWLGVINHEESIDMIRRVIITILTEGRDDLAVIERDHLTDTEVDIVLHVLNISTIMSFDRYIV